jgi:hypothetical protein
MAVGEGVRGKEKAEVIWDEWERNGKDGKDGEAKQKRGNANCGDGKDAVLRQAREGALDAREPFIADRGRCESHENGKDSQGELDSQGGNGMIRARSYGHENDLTSLAN